MPKPKEPRTHFQQVPVKVVKEIAKDETPDDEAIDTGKTAKRPVKR